MNLNKRKHAYLLQPPPRVLRPGVGLVLEFARVKERDGAARGGEVGGEDHLEGADDGLEAEAVLGEPQAVPHEGAPVVDDGLLPPFVEARDLLHDVRGVQLAPALGGVAAREEQPDGDGEAPRALVDDEVGPRKGRAAQLLHHAEGRGEAGRLGGGAGDLAVFARLVSRMRRDRLKPNKVHLGRFPSGLDCQ